MSNILGTEFFCQPTLYRNKTVSITHYEFLVDSLPSDKESRVILKLYNNYDLLITYVKIINDNKLDNDNIRSAFKTELDGISTGLGSSMTGINFKVVRVNCASEGYIITSSDKMSSYIILFKSYTETNTVLSVSELNFIISIYSITGKKIDTIEYTLPSVDIDTWKATGNSIIKTKIESLISASIKIPKVSIPRTTGLNLIYNNKTITHYYTEYSNELLIFIAFDINEVLIFRTSIPLIQSEFDGYTPNSYSDKLLDLFVNKFKYLK